MLVAYATPLICVICGLSILLMLLRPRNLPEVYWVGTGALMLVALGLVPLPEAAHAIAAGADVYFFLIGMMLLSELARGQGVFDWVASRAIAESKGSPQRLFAILYGVGTLVTVCLSNDATAVVLTPAVLAAVRQSKVDARPFVFACAMVANAASFVLPISNPANLVVFSTGVPPLAMWLRQFLLPSLLAIATTYGVLRWYFRRSLTGRIESLGRPTALTKAGRLVLGGLAIIVVLLLVVSARHEELGWPTCLAALGLTLVLSLSTRRSPWPLFQAISWPTLGLVAALFVLVSAAQSAGALQFAVGALRSFHALGPMLGPFVTALTVAVANNLLNNLPLGLLIGAALRAVPPDALITTAVLIGVDLGPNLSVTGSLATILWLLALRKENIDVGARDFLLVGLLAMPLALAASMGGVFALHALWPGVYG